MLDIREIVRLARAGESNREMARLLHCGRNTVDKYRRWAEQHQLLSGDLPIPDEVAHLLEQARPPASGLPGPVSIVRGAASGAIGSLKRTTEYDLRRVCQSPQQQGDRPQYSMWQVPITQAKQEPQRFLDAGIL